MANPCTCPTLAECARTGCPHCRQEIATGRPATDKACTVAGSPPCPQSAEEIARARFLAQDYGASACRMIAWYGSSLKEIVAHATLAGHYALEALTHAKAGDS